MKSKGYFFRFFSIILSIIFIFSVLEITCRFFIDFQKDYYSAPIVSNNKKFIIHPYGKIPINKFSFYDEEINFENGKTKIAFFGDSVTYGVGAGYPYRFTEYLDRLNSKFDHLNITGGLGVSLLDWSDKYEKFLIDNKVKRIVYVMNLNDVAPLSNYYTSQSQILKKKDKVKDLNLLKIFSEPLDNIFRGKSMLYTYTRFKIKNFFIRRGFEASGFKSIELFPEENKSHIINASKVINEWSTNLTNKGFKICVVVIPYEMQIATNAEQYYKSIGIKFEKGFENFTTQEILKNNLYPSLETLIIKDGFSKNKVGHYFVHNKGDKIDFNHPNREGHLVIAKEIAKYKICQN